MRREKQRSRIRDEAAYEKRQAAEQKRDEALVDDVATKIAGAIRKKFDYHLEGCETQVLVCLSEAGVLGRQRNRISEGKRLELLKKGLNFAAVHLIEYSIHNDGMVSLRVDEPAKTEEEDMEIHWMSEPCMRLTPSSASILREEFSHY